MKVLLIEDCDECLFSSFFEYNKRCECRLQEDEYGYYKQVEYEKLDDGIKELMKNCPLFETSPEVEEIYNGFRKDGL